MSKMMKIELNTIRHTISGPTNAFNRYLFTNFIEAQKYFKRIKHFQLWEGKFSTPIAER
jgi:hypothetical protein